MMPRTDRSCEADTLIEAALSYTKRGWRVFPVHTPSNGGCSCGDATCDNIGKHPRTAHGFKDATIDESTVRQWWVRCPDANIGLRTGIESGLIVLDVDPAKGGADSLADLERRHGSLPTTVESLTGGGGRHILFAHPGDGQVIRNSIGEIGPGLDVRSDGGYVVVPPSVHASGRQYAWEISSEPDDVPLAPLPPWLLDLIVQPNGAERRTTERFDTAKALAGVPEGQRDDMLFGFTGKLRHADVPQDFAEQLVLEAAAKCTPPFPEAAARAKVRNVYARYEPGDGQGTRESYATRSEAGHGPQVGGNDVPPRADPWPVLNVKALHGLAGEVVRLLKPHTEADPVALLASFLAEVGTMLGRGSHLILDGSYHPLLFWPVLVGRSSKSRKGSAGNRIRTICAMADPNWTRGECKGTLSSGEGLAYAVRDPQYREEPVKKERGQPTGETMRICVDSGVEDKRLFLVQAEFGSVLRVMGRDGNSLSGVIRDAWDALDLAPMTKSNRVRATAPHIGIVGHVTKEELLRNLTDTEASNGFGNRFPWLLVQRSQELPFSSSPDDRAVAELACKIGKSIQCGQAISTIEMTDHAKEGWKAIYHDLSADRPGLAGGLLGRAEAHVMRLAGLYAILDERKSIDLVHLKAALALWEYAEASTFMIFGDATGDPIADTIIRAIRTSGELDDSQVSALFGRNLSAARLERAKATVLSAGTVHCVALETGGRPRMVWRPGTKKTN